ncbi:MAG: hypothetical protein AAF721_19640 [Myxococcota bacterium]
MRGLQTMLVALCCGVGCAQLQQAPSADTGADSSTGGDGMGPGDDGGPGPGPNGTTGGMTPMDPDDDDDADGEADTMPVDQDDTTGSEPGDSSTAGGEGNDTSECDPPPGVYANCPEDEPCDDPAGFCLQSNAVNGVCGFECQDVCDCPAAPGTGTALVACTNLFPKDKELECHLDCGDGRVCPDGMTCFADSFCQWDNSVVGDYEGCVADFLTCPEGSDCLVASPLSACGFQGCVDSSDCPAAPPGGTVECDNVAGDATLECYLECSSNPDCPDGWECVVAASVCAQSVPG